LDSADLAACLTDIDFSCLDELKKGFYWKAKTIVFDLQLENSSLYHGVPCIVFSLEGILCSRSSMLILGSQ